LEIPPLAGDVEIKADGAGSAGVFHRIKHGLRLEIIDEIHQQVTRTIPKVVALAPGTPVGITQERREALAGLQMSPNTFLPRLGLPERPLDCGFRHTRRPCRVPEGPARSTRRRASHTRFACS